MNMEINPSEYKVLIVDDVTMIAIRKMMKSLLLPLWEILKDISIMG